ncbi:MAG: hypothetical protein V9G19_16640 [Tetrasphaera sp.]
MNQPAAADAHRPQRSTIGLNATGLDAAGQSAASAVGVSAVGLSPIGKAWRTLVLLALAALFLGGTFVGDDHWWPFSPWRMFSTSTGPNASVRSTLIEVRDAAAPATWRAAPIEPDSVGLNRAEVEGRLDHIQGRPDMLATLAASHSRLEPDEPAWIGIRVVVRHYLLRDGALTGEHRDQLIAQWSVR